MAPAPKTCVFCTGELSPAGPAKKTTGGKFKRKFRCKECNQPQDRILDPSDPYAGAETRKPDAPRRKPKSSRPIALTKSLSAARPTPASLAKHNYQRKLAAHYAPHILPATFQALHDGVINGNPQVVKTVLELYELIETKNRVSIVNDNRSVNIDARNESGGSSDGTPQRRSFESIARQLEVSREKRLEQGNPLATKVLDAEFAEATPEGISK